MSSGPLDPRDPFEAGQREALNVTDGLLDRIGARTPTPDDLDDPLVAALALMAAEIDLDAVPVDVTHAAVEAAFPDLLMPFGEHGAGLPAHDERTGLVLDLRDDHRDDHRDHHHDDHDTDRDADAVPLLRAVAGTPAGRGWDQEAAPLRKPRRLRRRPETGTGAMAPPRSLARPAPDTVGSVTGMTERRGRRERRLHPLTAVAAVVAALVLGTGVSAAVTGGKSVNPLEGIQKVVEQLRGGRTADQQQVYDRDLRIIDQAADAADSGRTAKAKSLLATVDTASLTDEDKKVITARVENVRKTLDR